MVNEVEDIREQIARLAARIDVLETEKQSVRPSTAPDDAQAFWALDALQGKLEEHPSTAGGAVMIVGSLTLPNGSPVAWQQGAGTTGLFDLDWGERAAAFAALGHPVRMELLRQLLSGVHATADLAAIESLGTTGQLHHHLRQLVAAGWVRQAGRGNYEVPPARIVPLLAALVGAE